MDEYERDMLIIESMYTERDCLTAALMQYLQSRCEMTREEALDALGIGCECSECCWSTVEELVSGFNEAIRYRFYPELREGP